MDTDIILSEITAVLKPFGVEKILLFGSSETRDFRIRLKKALWKKFAKLNYSFDILVDDEQRIQERISIGDLFYKDIYSNGKVIYA